MSNLELIAKLKNELTALEYTPVGIGNYCAYARQFLEYLASRQIAVGGGENPRINGAGRLERQ
ncbi:hypothetical protein [Acidiphilium acidophilum]|uniref:hypothetical protein n=1 Tax=Acidiphilium acidophilum TaxID=76588 RepID=UPI002E8E70D4|nr:hypothetical protein [Acidiphilium acidophilum]